MPSLAGEPFTTVEAVRAECSCAVGATDEQIQSWIDEASDIIAVITGMTVYGRMQVVARPCRFGVRCGCACCGLDSIPLGDPKPTIDEILINGDVLDPDDYDLHWGLNGWNLVHLGDGTRPPTPWPTYQERWKSEDQPGTFAIHLTVGVDPGRPLIQAAVFEIICEFAARAAGSSKNQLPRGTISANLGSTQIQVDADILDRLQRGELGPAVTQMLAILAPQGRAQSAVYAPELTEWDLGLRPAPVVGP